MGGGTAGPSSVRVVTPGGEGEVNDGMSKVAGEKNDGMSRDR